MSKIVIVRPDGQVGVDGVFRLVDLSAIAASISVVVYDTAKGKGHVEFSDDLDPRPPNAYFTDFSMFQPCVDAWTAAAPLPPPPLTPQQIADAADQDDRNSQVINIRQRAFCKMLRSKNPAHIEDNIRQAAVDIPTLINTVVDLSIAVSIVLKQ